MTLYEVTDKDADNMRTLENAFNVLGTYADAWMESNNPNDHIQIQNPHNAEEIVDFGDSPTFALTIEGIASGAATELIQEGFDDVVEAMAERHGISLNTVKGGEHGERANER